MFYRLMEYRMIDTEPAKKARASFDGSDKTKNKKLVSSTTVIRLLNRPLRWTSTFHSANKFTSDDEFREAIDAEGPADKNALPYSSLPIGTSIFFNSSTF